MAKDIEQVQHSIEMDEAIQLHKIGWTVQRIGWVLILLLLVLAALGLFGTGPLSHKQLEAGGNAIAYERFARYEANTALRFTAVHRNGAVMVQIPQQYLRDFEIASIVPEPQEVQTINGYYVYRFAAVATLQIVMRGMHQQSGTVETTILVNNMPFTISQFIYP